MNKQEILKKLIREEVRKELIKENKFVDLIIKLFFKGKIKNAVEDLKNDPDIQDKFRSLEFALQDLKDATDRKNDLYNSPEYIELSKKYGRKDAFGQKYGPKAKDK
jgi:hypothetical protein